MEEAWLWFSSFLATEDSLSVWVTYCPWEGREEESLILFAKAICIIESMEQVFWIKETESSC